MAANCGVGADDPFTCIQGVSPQYALVVYTAGYTEISPTEMAASRALSYNSKVARWGQFVRESRTDEGAL